MYKLLNYLIAAVWMANGLICKVLNIVPRHQQIVARILGDEHAVLFTRLIGCSEIAMAIWILSGLYPRLNAVTQVIIIAVMNVLEYILAPDLLLWGKFNIVFAFLFISVILYRAFYVKKGIVE